ncbi:hypothetical protein [Hymenobacter ruricola]|uniref:Uncharacterized protein n=1 Tax=Hymenobacter ruricola TaxID=2791023 RepID=A0ABS0I993_9BACT|nr:hypothetical protein [Hymenobacter ruricola]MBF9223531.1 hypothetical protein [Hymenobacter ruricola]
MLLDVGFETFFTFVVGGVSVLVLLLEIAFTYAFYKSKSLITLLLFLLVLFVHQVVVRTFVSLELVTQSYWMLAPGIFMLFMNAYLVYAKYGTPRP